MTRKDERMTAEPDRKPAYLTAVSLRERGWTPAMIRDLLGEPDETRPNPVYRSAAPVRLWDEDRVTGAEAATGFAGLAARGARRSAAGTAAADSRRAALAAEIAAVIITVPVLHRDALTRRACDAYNRRQWDVRADADWDWALASENSDPAFLERIAVNYLRHELTDYESHLDAIAGRTGVRDGERLVRARVYDAIASAYPDLAAECRRQLAWREAQDGARQAGG
jgi:hypothetical protein